VEHGLLIATGASAAVTVVAVEVAVVTPGTGNLKLVFGTCVESRFWDPLRKEVGKYVWQSNLSWKSQPCPGGKAYRPLHTAIAWGRPNIVATLLAMGARSLEKDNKGLTAHGVCVEADKFIKGVASRSLAVTLPDKETLHINVTREGVHKAIRIAGDDSSSSEDEFAF
jgi:hypothetical protein